MNQFDAFETTMSRLNPPQYGLHALDVVHRLRKLGWDTLDGLTDVEVEAAVEDAVCSLKVESRRKTAIESAIADGRLSPAARNEAIGKVVKQYCKAEFDTPDDEKLGAAKELGIPAVLVRAFHGPNIAATGLWYPETYTEVVNILTANREQEGIVLSEDYWLCGWDDVDEQIVNKRIKETQI